MKLSIRNKLIFLLVIPLFCIGILVGLRVRSDLQTVHEMNAVTDLAELTQKISILLHSTQKERGMTAGFLGSKDAKFQSELFAQRNNTDQNIENFHGFLADFDAPSYSSEFTTAVNQAISSCRTVSPYHLN